MDKRPLLDELPEDQEYTKEIGYGNKKMHGMFSRDAWAIYFAIAIYLVVCYFFKLDFKYVWLVGFPVLCVISSLHRLNSLNTIIAYEHARSFEYFNKHILHRIETINEDMRK